MTATAILKNLVIENPRGSGVIDTLENDRIAYQNCEIRDSVVLIRGNSAPFQGCLFRNCEIRTEGGAIHGLRGQNMALDCDINGVKRKDFRTY